LIPVWIANCLYGRLCVAQHDRTAILTSKRLCA
uniref:Reverse transcriptase n=1 Tax=Haemonchus placei TaxID=6290 RepID=A0A0N4VVL4_HAEPC